MIYFLENTHIRITVSTAGGELHSITNTEDELEYLWQGHAAYWTYRSPHLFPIVGKLKNSKYKIDGKEYELPSHGFARTSEFNVISQSCDSITLELKYSEDTLAVYPFKFSLQVTYTIEKNRVKIIYDIINLDNKKIYFSLGAHPAFRCPLEPIENFEDYFLIVNKKENSAAMCFNNDAYFTHEKKEYFKNNRNIALKKEIFRHEALVFNDLKSNEITLQSKNHERCIRLEFGEFPYLGIWSPLNDAQFVCIEPWFGHADYEDFEGEFKDKEGVVSLQINNTFTCSYSIFIE